MAQSFTPPSPVLVAPNISGDVFYGDYAFKVNTNNGTIIYNQARPPVKLKATPLPAPAAPLNFFDRAAESAQLDLIINTHSRLTVVGPEGVGKSTLLRQVANSDTAKKLPHGVVLADGADAEGTRLSINDVIQQLFDQLYDSEPYLKVTAVTARVHLAQTQPLVLIDNVRFPSPDSLRTLIDLFPQSPILLAMPYSPGGNLTRLVDLGPLPRTDAVQLFAATLNQPTGKLNRATINAICATLNNVPLAITTVADAVRTNNLPVDDVLATLNQIKPASSDPIQAGLERAYGLVYSTLSPLERQVLAIAASLPAKSIDPEMIQRMVTGELATLPGGEIKREGNEVNIGGVRVPIRDAANVPDKDDTQPTTINRVSAAIDKLKGMGLLRSNSPRLRIAAGLRLIAQIDVDQDAIHNQLVFQLLNDVRLNKHLNWQYCADELGNILGAIEWAAGQQRWTDVILLGRAIDP
ncbi:MAG TPA: ATP-binding protein, partial [Anaerolineae bacterium]|nr:ATP-binding protein [Anaerolineae bacterium]